MKVYIIVPVLNAMPDWPAFSTALLANLAEMEIPASRVLIIDSQSSDGSAQAAKQIGFRVMPVLRSDFDHGATRQLGADLVEDAEILIYLTQDAILAENDSIRKLLAAFDDPETGAAYGRQLPRIGASPIEAHARYFNYPAESQVRSLESRRQLGFKSIFFSNSFGAYRRTALQQVGGFSGRTIFGEDTIVTARLHLAGWKTAYIGSARAYHSHAYPLKREFQRYFDIGVLHTRESWLVREFGGASNEGLKFLLSETRFLWPRWFHRLPAAWLRTLLKWSGYQLGKKESALSRGAKKRFSMNRSFWEK